MTKNTSDKKNTSLTRNSGLSLQARIAIEVDGIDETIDFSDAETVSIGGTTKWVDLRKFQEDEKVAQNQPVKGNGKAFAGVLIGRQAIEVGDKEDGDVKPDGTKVRYFYTFRLVAPCPVTFKNDDNDVIEGEAYEGDIVALGERHAMKSLRALVDDGGVYVIVIRPHSRVKIGHSQTMWTFDILKKTIRAANKPQVVLENPPF